MSNHYIGLDLFDLENNGLRQPISRITLYRGDNAALTAGDDTGLEVVADCIYVTQEMVEALLSAARGYQYHAYSAQAARLNPAAELGDTVEVGNIVSVLAQISDHGDLYPDIAAPGDREVEDEYPAAGPLTKAFDKKLAEARSEIAKTTDQITLAIYGEDGKGGLSGKMTTFSASLIGLSGRIDGVEGNYTEFEANLEGISAEVRGVEDEVSYLQLGLDGIKGRVEDAEGNIATLEVASTNMRSEIEGKIDGAGAQSLIDQSLDQLTLSVSTENGVASITLKTHEDDPGIGGTIDMTGLVTFNALEDGPEGKTTIHGGWLKGVTLEGNTIKGGTYKNLGGDTWFGLGESGGKWGFRLSNTDNEQEGIFGIYNGDGGYTSLSGKSGYTFLMTDGSEETSFPQGTWDFSQANLITKGEVGFVPVFQ